MSWKDDKDLGSWDFAEQPNKWGYLNNPRWMNPSGKPVSYDGREDEEPQIFEPEQLKGDNADEDKHNPCGHWHKQIEGQAFTSPPSEIPGFEVYFELLNESVSQPNILSSDDLLVATSFIPINENDFDGNPEWYFEVIGFNSNTFDVTVQAVDSNGTVCGTVVIAAGIVGVTGYELYRYRVAFTPTVDDDIGMYGLKISKPNGDDLNYYPLDCTITVARIIVRQSGAFKTKIQIPMYGSSYTYNGQEGSAYPYDYPIGNQLINDHAIDDLTLDVYRNTSVWQFNSSELDNVSKVVFSPAARAAAVNTFGPTTQGIFGSQAFEHFHYQLYSTTGTDIARADATPAFWVDENQVHVDDISGLTYTPVPDSYISWDDGTGPYPFTWTLYPDFSSLGTGTHYIMIGGELYIGLPTENIWEHWPNVISITIPAGYTVTDAVLQIDSTLPNNMTWKISYSLTPDAGADLELSLYDITAAAKVVGSELIWELNDGFSRQFAEFNPNLLISGHEYRLGITWTDGTYIAAEVMDAQLLININEIAKLTVWQRCGSRHNDSWDNWTIPDTWGADYWTTPGHGANNISPRVKFYQPLGTVFVVYFESTGYGIYSYGVGQEDYMRIWLENFGASGESGSTGSDVVGSLIEWTEDIYEDLLRKRSGALTLTLDQLYGNRRPDIAYEIRIPNSFIVIRVF